MREVPRDQILRRIRLENPWWHASGAIPERMASWTPRPYLEMFRHRATRDVRRAIVLMGPRRVGKTVLIHHYIDALLADGTPAKQLCYLSIDVPVYNRRSLEEMLDLYVEAAGLDSLRPGSVVFFDEIQYLPQWEQHLKTLVDAFPTIKVVASGSAAAALRLKSQESGAGRVTDFLLPPLSFHEYLALLGIGDLVRVDERDEVRWYSTPDIEELNLHFEKYLNYGGYPEAALSQDIQDDPGTFIKSDIIDKVLLRDLPSLYGIANLQELNALFTTLAFNTAEEMSLDALNRESGVAKQTISKYIEYLEAAFLVTKVHRVDRSAKRFVRQRHFKIHLTNSSIRTALFGPLDQTDPGFGHLVETGLFSQLLHAPSWPSLHYARWKEGEIDIVALNADQSPGRSVEVKWTDRYLRQPGREPEPRGLGVVRPHAARMRELAPAIRFCARHNVGRLVVTTRTLIHTTKQSNVELHFWPAALYAYASGADAISLREEAELGAEEF